MANLSITAANVQPAANAVLKSGTAGATITAGQPVYEDENDGNKLKPCRASTAAAAAAVGVAAASAAANQPVSYQTSGDIDLGVTLDVGVIYVVAEELPAGSIAPSGDLGTGDYTTVLGVATAADALSLSIIISDTAVG